MLFHSSLRKELARSFGATLVVLIIIVMTMTLIRTLSQATRGNVNPSEVMMVMGYVVLGYLPPILTLSLFVAIVGTLSRLYSDHEMDIWFASGRGIAGFVSPLLRFAWPVLAVITVLAMLIWPWANQQAQDLRERYVNRGDLERVAPGQFQESANGRRVFFLEKDTPDNRSGRSIFIATQDHGRDTITSATSGRVEARPEGQMLLLSKGQRLETLNQGGQLRVSEFEEYGARINERNLAALDTAPAKTRSTQTLLSQPTAVNLGELAWRLGLALAALNLVLLALLVCRVNPRAGRSANLLLALFIFIVYYNLINVGNTWVSAGRVNFATWLLALHGGVFLLALLWLSAQHHQWSWRNLLPSRRAASQAA